MSSDPDPGTDEGRRPVVEPRVTVVVATRNRREELLGHLDAHEGPVVVVDNASTDRTAQAVHTARPAVRVIALTRNVGAVARTIGARAADTPYVAFADDDSWWAPAALSRAADVFDATPRLGLLAGNILVGPEQRPDPINDVLAASPLGRPPGWPGPALLGFVACGTVVRRAAFLAVGGFDPVVRFPGEEERVALDLHDAGWWIAHVPDLVAHHHPSPRRESDARRQRDLVRSRILTAMLRRPWPVVGAQLRRAAADAAGRRALAEALPRLPLALWERRPVGAATEAALERLHGEEPLALSPVDGPAPSAVTRAVGAAASGAIARTCGTADTGVDDRVSVVLITHQRRDEALLALSRLRELPERPQVVVVDNGSSDGTAEAVRRQHPWVDLVASPANLGAVGRNVGVERLSTPYVAFCDDDTWWDPGALRRAADVLAAHPRLAVVTGHIVVEPDGTDDPIDAELLHSPVVGPEWLPGPALGSFLAGASVVRREAFVQVGGFDARLWLGGEEELLAADLATAGWELCHLPDVVVRHQASVARDADLRRRHGIRNTLWFTWLRRPWRAALRRTGDVLRSAPRDRVTAAAIADAVRGVGWVWRERRPLPERVERRFRALEDSQRHSTARRYLTRREE